jgi:hypothetical protein
LKSGGKVIRNLNNAFGLKRKMKKRTFVLYIQLLAGLFHAKLKLHSEGLTLKVGIYLRFEITIGIEEETNMLNVSFSQNITTHEL